ncbi:NfeD family protein [Leptolyngbya sp. FACHB-711]|uniref:NfeD family protein n=1 Tax=Leptolyngbya sp. FACHB-711 TaxID=2692813 RepID=UPI001688ADCC|nr:NfeD family protein [Leptolyngbya sp. FACHB-711]MBD2028266.1 NfeD family protein [Leptolyngbya sp. FACHB-711]
MKETLLSLANRFFFSSEIYTSSYLVQSIPYYYQEAVVIRAILPGQRGRIQIGSSFWFARCPQPILLMPEAVVQVMGRDNITLLVKPIQPLLPTASPEQFLRGNS